MVQEILEVETSEDFESLVTKIQLEHSQNTENYGQLVGNTLLGLEKQSEEERSLSEIRKFCKIIQSSEYRIHESQAEAHMCMKRILSPSEYATLNTNATETMSGKIKEMYFALMNKISRKCCPAKKENKKGLGKRFWIQTKRFVKVAALHLDLTKDFLLLLLLLNVLGDAQILFDPNFCYLFQTQFVWAWLLSIVTYTVCP